MRLSPQQPRNSPDVAQAVYDVGSGGASNCIDKNFDCNYGLQVTFLAKNSITVRAEDIEQSGNVASRNRGSYSKIQFVNEDPLSIDNLVASQVSSPGSDVETTSTPLPFFLSPSSRRILQGNVINRCFVSNSVSDREGKGDNGPNLRHPQEEKETDDTYGDARSHPQHRATLAPWDLDSHARAHLHSHATLPVTLEPPIRPNTFSAKDEFAVRGLLALGTQAGAEPGPGPGSSGGESIPIAAGAEALENEEIGPIMDAGGTPGKAISVVSPGFVDGVLQSTVGQGVSTPAADSILNFATGSSNAHSYSHPHQLSEHKSTLESWKMELLQNYRYKVAPWLDILDLSHSFGITALQIAFGSSSERLLHALLALPETCLRVQKGRGYSNTAIQLDAHVYTHGFQAVRYEDAAAPYSDSLANADVAENFTEAVLLRLLEELGRLVADVARAWALGQGEYEQDGHSRDYEYGPLRSLADRAYGLDMDSAIYWMFLRIDLGKSLANNTPPRTPLPPHPLPSLSLLVRTENTHERVGHYAQALLWLCGKALNIYHQQDPAPPHQGPGPDSWFQVFEELSQWHYLRTQEFQPMVELSPDGGDVLNAGSEFPMLLFTNGAAALCSQLYHTAMLYMVECKPRTATALLNQHQKLHPHTPVLSPLWHAHRGRVLGSVSTGILSCCG
ncbi:hypothetical protein BDV10DRAFT_192422 [Aspergillus recurvatus]